MGCRSLAVFRPMRSRLPPRTSRVDNRNQTPHQGQDGLVLRQLQIQPRPTVEPRNRPGLPHLSVWGGVFSAFSDPTLTRSDHRHGPTTNRRRLRMYTKGGESYFVVDGHTHFWDGSPANQANIHGKMFIDCFYDYHKNLSPEEWVWPKDKFEKYSERDLIHDLFEIGYVDKAIFQPTFLTDFYTNGFNTTDQDGAIAEKYPDKFIVNGAWDPRDGDRGLRVLEESAKRWNLKGVKLYTDEWRGDSHGWKLSEPEAFKYLAKCQELGIKNIHVHKGPTIRPLERDAFDVHDVDVAATEFTGLNFIVEHVGLPRLEDFCWIGVQEPNVYGGLAVAMPFIFTRPRYFAQVLGELLYWIGADRLLWASDYAIWHPKWLVEQFVDFAIPEDMVSEYGQLTPDIKRKILGLNAARLYNLEVPAPVSVGGNSQTGLDVSERPAVVPAP